MKLVPIYLIAGNDASAINLEAETIIKASKDNNYEVVTQDNIQNQNLSLFSNKQIIQVNYYNDINASESKSIIEKCINIKKHNNLDSIFIIKIYNSEQINKKTKLLDAVRSCGKVIIKIIKNINAFNLIDAAKKRDSNKTIAILMQLKQLDFAPVLILWALTNHLRKIKNYQMLILAQSIDASIKGIESELLWHKLKILCLRICKN